jgi:DNA-binding CsgD family transcriptional regulator
MGVRELTRARDRLLGVHAGEVEANQICEHIVSAVGDITTFGWCALLTVDPETMLPGGGVVQGFDPSLCAPFWDNELLDPDFQKFTDLARSAEPVGTLADATDGDLARSPRYQKMWSHLGAADELRVAFNVGTTCLAIGSFVRPGAAGPFPAEEVADVRALVPTAAVVLRTALSAAHRHHVHHARAVLILDADGSITSMTAGSRTLLDDLQVTSIDEQNPVPGILAAAATKARWSRSDDSLTTRVRGRTGHWMRIEVTRMEGESGSVAVTIEPARPDDLVQMQIDSYGLTGRETDILVLLCKGLSAKEMAAELYISAHTVRDHVKAIYDKANVSSRGELVAHLFADAVFRQIENNVSHLA